MSNPFERLDGVPASEEKPHQNTVDSFVGNATRSFAYSMCQSPINGAMQLADHIAGTKLLPRVQFVEAPTPANAYTSDWVAQQIGGGLGTALPFLAAGYVGKLASSERTLGETTVLSTNMPRQMTLGAVYAGVLTPVNDNNDFFGQRLKNAVAGTLAFGAMEGTSALIVKASTSSPAILSSVMRSEAVNRVSSGLITGAATANIDSLVHNGRLASGSETISSAVSFALLNGAMAGGRRLAQGDPTEARAGQLTSSTAAIRTDAPVNVRGSSASSMPLLAEEPPLMRIAHDAGDPFNRRTTEATSGWPEPTQRQAVNDGIQLESAPDGSLGIGDLSKLIPGTRPPNFFEGAQLRGVDVHLNVRANTPPYGTPAEALRRRIVEGAIHLASDGSNRTTPKA